MSNPSWDVQLLVTPVEQQPWTKDAANRVGHWEEADRHEPLKLQEPEALDST